MLVVLGALLVQLAILPPAPSCDRASARWSRCTPPASSSSGGWGSASSSASDAVAALSLRHAGLPDGLQSVIQTEILFVVAWFVGDAARIRRLYARAREERERLLEAQREERAARDRR